MNPLQLQRSLGPVVGLSVKDTVAAAGGVSRQCAGQEKCSEDATDYFADDAGLGFASW